MNPILRAAGEFNILYSYQFNILYSATYVPGVTCFWQEKKGDLGLRKKALIVIAYKSA
mgnify:CR=1